MSVTTRIAMPLNVIHANLSREKVSLAACNRVDSLPSNQLAPKTSVKKLKILETNWNTQKCVIWEDILCKFSQVVEKIILNFWFSIAMRKSGKWNREKNAWVSRKLSNDHASPLQRILGIRDYGWGKFDESCPIAIEVPASVTKCFLVLGKVV